MSNRGNKDAETAASGSGVSQSAAVDSTAALVCAAPLIKNQQKLVDAILLLGRLPKRNKGTSDDKIAENKLAKQFSEYKANLPEHVLSELGFHGDVDQSAAGNPIIQNRKLLIGVRKTPAQTSTKGSVSSSSHRSGGGADQRTAETATVRKVVNEVRQFGRCPKAQLSGKRTKAQLSEAICVFSEE
mgnify:CR=1 FL=1